MNTTMKDCSADAASIDSIQITFNLVNHYKAGIKSSIKEIKDYHPTMYGFPKSFYESMLKDREKSLKKQEKILSFFKKESGYSKIIKINLANSGFYTPPPDMIF